MRPAGLAVSGASGRCLSEGRAAFRDLIKRLKQLPTFWGVPHYKYSFHGPQNPILSIEAPVLCLEFGVKD